MKSLLLLSFFSLFIVFSSSKGYVTYHSYSATFPLTSCACSDGKNGLMTRWKYVDLSKMYPYVTSFSSVQWNSPNCGKCLKLVGPKATIYVTTIDMCGPAPSGYDAHFDVAPEAFKELYGGLTAGVGSVEWSYAPYQNCRGNRG